MAQVRLIQLEEHVGWQPGEIVTVQVTTLNEDGSYTCATLETYPPDLKEKHAAELAAHDAAHQAMVDEMRRQ